MIIKEYDKHDELLTFYRKRGIEELDDYPAPPIFSYIVVIDEKNIIGAATCSLNEGI